MRNLKKFLALVLAMVMAMSLMVTANAANTTFDDSSEITAQFEEAALVLSGLGVFKGTDEGKFNPKGEITRAEVAAIIYRLATGDVNDRQVHIYDDYGKFKDVAPTAWYAGYVGYCANAEYIKGSNGYFYPMNKVTGYEALAMILRAVGYDQNSEFSGSGWQVRVASLSKQLGVTANVVNSDFDTTLNKAATREVVADLLFQTAATVPTVTYTPALSYNDKQNVLGGVYNPTLGQKIFGLWYATSWQTIDEWGRPGYNWYKNGSWDGRATTDANTGKAYVIKDNHPLYTGNTAGNVVATIKADVSYDTNKVQVRECDVAQGLEFTGSETFPLYVNDKNPITNDYLVVATDTVTPVGGQGRIAEFYYGLNSRWFRADNGDRAVMIDTMLAQVNSKSDAVLDPAGHVITPAKLDVTIWDGKEKTNVATANQDTLSNRTISKPNGTKENWDEYTRGDYILIHGYTSKGAAPAGNTNRTTQAQKEMAAFETNKVPTGTTGYPANTLVQGNNVWVLQKAESIQGKQTVTYWNQAKHQVDGKDYPDQLCLFLDRAGSNTNTTFTWFFDLFGNIIGIGDAKSTNYGVITDIYSAFAQGEGDTTGAVKAVASVKYADGTTGTVTIDRFLMSTTDTAANAIGTFTAGTAKTDANKVLTADGTVAAGGAADGHTVDLRPLYDTTSHPAMTPGVADPVFTAKDAQFPGYIYIAPSTVSNRYAHFEAASQDVYGILYDHMFEFTTASDNSVVAIEVAGKWTAANGYENEDLYVNKANNVVDSTNIGVLYKNLGFLTLDYGDTEYKATVGNAGAAAVYVDNDTKIIVRTGTGMGDTKINTYDGVSALPGNVILPQDSQVDWADTDNDGRADYLYVTGNIPGTITYGLFYYNGGASQWNGTTGTMAGYLNGDATTLTFNSLDLFNAINNSKTYDGHLFAIQITNDVVSGVFMKDNDDTMDSATTSEWTDKILMAWDAATSTFVNATGTDVVVSALKLGTTFSGTTATPGTTAFGVGSVNGNNYSVTTEAIYYLDQIAAAEAGQTNLAYVRTNNGYRIRVFDDTNVMPADPATGTATAEYWIAPNAKIIGELEWLNYRQCDVTIVFDNGGSGDNANAVVEVYVTPDPDVTPSGEDPVPVTDVTPGAGVTTMGLTVVNDFQNALKAAGPNCVIYNAGAKADATWTTPAEDMLYFPFVQAVANSAVTLRIVKDGVVMYYEVCADAGAVGGHFFGIDVTGQQVSTDAAIHQPFTAGNYSYTIVDAAGTLLSSGTFTMNLAG